MKCQSFCLSVSYWFNWIFQFLTPAGDLFIRFVVAYHFFRSGLAKITSMDTAVMLFKHEYHVPILSPKVAAYLGTYTELIFPVLLLVGLGGRFPAFVLSIFNAVAVYAYQNFLFSEAGGEGLEDHFYWGILLMVTLLHGPGKLTLDNLIRLLCWKCHREP